MRFCTLASGSSGNSLYLETGGTRLLVDAGISVRQLARRLKMLDLGLEDLDAAILTHEHTDHSSAAHRLPMPVYVAEATSHVWEDKVPDLVVFDSTKAFEIGHATITPFSVSHDAIDPVGFTVESEEGKLGLATDIGHVTALVRERLRGCGALVLEFNHDEKLLEYGPYPWVLKQRIRGRLGHLSNNQASDLVKSLMHEGLRFVVMAHMSESNNSPDVALATALGKLNGMDAGQVELSVAPRKSPGEVFEI